MATTKYLPASFRGAEFLVESSSDEGGPRNIIHEFPGRQYAQAEPSGMYPARFAIEAHLLGDAFEQQLLDLEEALDQSGPGKLVHPHRGSKLVALDGPYRIQRSTRELGMVRVSISFVEDGPTLEPRVTPDTSSDVIAKAKIAYTHINASKLDVQGPDFLTRAAELILAGPRSITAAISRINNRINAAFGLIDEVSSTIDEFSSEAQALLNTPDTLALHLRNLVNSVLTVIKAGEQQYDRGDKLRNLKRVAQASSYLTTLGTFGDTLPEVATPTAMRQRQADNQAVLVDLVETAALIETVVVLVDIPLDNTDQAGELFDQVAGVFDRITDRGSIDDAASQALRDLRAAFHVHLRRTAAELPGLGRYTPQVTLPALVLAYQLYGDASRDEDILERNPSIEHPGFVQGDVSLAIATV